MKHRPNVDVERVQDFVVYGYVLHHPADDAIRARWLDAERSGQFFVRDVMDTAVHVGAQVHRHAVGFLMPQRGHYPLAMCHWLRHRFSPFKLVNFSLNLHPRMVQPG